ncbi:MAG: hypothetical protein N2260_01470 [Syntrophobacterales bacterium]|nr:hypothetical protein [Syntrophobacterales bacterium]
MTISRSKVNFMKSFALLFALIGLAGCGKKGFPVPSSVEKGPSRVDRITANIYPDGIEISWEIPRSGRDFSKYPYCFIVERAEIDWKGLSCKDCPDLPWQKSQCFHPAYPDPARVEADRMVWRDSKITAGRAYRYRVTVNERDSQRVVTASEPLDVRVYPPIELIRRILARSTDKGIIVEWQICPDQCREVGDSLGFKVERRSGSEGWKVISESNYKKTSYLDTELEGGKAYDYRVTPYYIRDGITVWGKPFFVSKVRAKTKILPPPPESVWVVPGKDGLEIHWLEPKGKIAGYNVYRKQSDGNIVRLNDKPVAHSPFVDRTALPNQIYGYAVSSVASDPSNTEGVTSSWIEIRNIFMKEKNK